MRTCRVNVNPAVSFGVFVAGRMKVNDLVGHIVAQVLGGLVEAWVLKVIATGIIAVYDVAAGGLGQNGWLLA